MKTFSTFLLFLFFLFTLFSQNNLSDIYQEGLINGEFQSKYSNGQLKVRGSFSNNLKTGKWNVWDSSGKIIMTREYGVNNEVSVETLNNKTAHVKESYQQEAFVRNDEGYFSFVQVLPNDVAYSKRLWRVIRNTEINGKLFVNNNLFNNWIELIGKGEIKGYSARTDQFEFVLDSSAIESYKGTKLVGYKVKEDWFFDNSRNTADTRIIGICPIIVIDGREIDAFWVYYPEVRKHLAKLNLDDIFFFHQFNSKIIRESNVNGKYISEYIEPEKEAEEILKIESHNIETEVSFWIKASNDGW